MDAPAFPPDSPLPTDVAALQAIVQELLAEVARLRVENAELKAKLDAATRHRFGRRSERRAPPPVPAAEKKSRRRDEHGRSPLPEHIERRDVVCDLADEQKRCPACGRVRECIGEQTAEQLDLDPPRFFVLRTRRRSYACRHCDPARVPAGRRIATAGPAQVGPIPKGLCGPGLLAHAVTAKFADHIPVHRLAGQLSRSGVKVRAVALGRNAWGVLGSEVGGATAAVLYSAVGTCKHLSIDPLAYLRETLPGLFALGEEPSAEQLSEWLPDRWLLNRTRDRPSPEVNAG